MWSVGTGVSGIYRTQQTQLTTSSYLLVPAGVSGCAGDSFSGPPFTSEGGTKSGVSFGSAVSLQCTAPAGTWFAGQCPLRTLPGRTGGPNQAWALDFVHDRLLDGGGFRALAVIDEWSRESLAIAHRRAGEETGIDKTVIRGTRFRKDQYVIRGALQPFVTEQMRRFTRLTNGFSKKLENHRAAVDL